MSFQPFPRTWYSSIPRTIAADWLRVYAFEPAVWWTTANADRARVPRGAAGDLLVRAPRPSRARSSACRSWTAPGATPARPGSRRTRRAACARRPPRGTRRGRRRRPSRGCRAASRCGSSSPGCPGRAGPRPRARPAATSSSGRRRHACGRAPCRLPCQWKPTRSKTRRRRRGRRRARAADRQVPRDDRRPVRGPRDRRGDEHEQGCEEERSHPVPRPVCPRRRAARGR